MTLFSFLNLCVCLFVFEICSTNQEGTKEDESDKVEVSEITATLFSSISRLRVTCPFAQTRQHNVMPTLPCSTPVTYKQRKSETALICNRCESWYFKKTEQTKQWLYLNNNMRAWKNVWKLLCLLIADSDNKMLPNTWHREKSISAFLFWMHYRKCKHFW